MSDGPQVPGVPPGLALEAIAQFRIDLAAGKGPDGKPVVLVTTSFAGGHVTIVLTVDQVRGFTEELERVARLSRSGLHVPPPGTFPPNGHRKA